VTASQRKKLIEVALPLDEINAACKADKDRKTGTIRNLHKWFAPMPLPAWRALLFAALVDDPEDDEQRARLLDVIKRLVVNGADLPDEETLREARGLIAAQFPSGVPTVMDPFCGGGSTLIEAQRLGLTSYGSDINPVPALISRTISEVLPAVHGAQPLHPEVSGVGRELQADLGLGLTQRASTGYEGLTRDVLHYGDIVKEGARRRLASIYPAQDGEELVAWTWARTAHCPNPACGAETILTSSWWLSRKKGELAWIEWDVTGRDISLRVVSNSANGEAPPSPKIGDGVFACLVCNATLDSKYLRSQGMQERLGYRMTGVITTQNVKGKKVRVYRTANPDDVAAALVERDPGESSIPIDPKGQGIRVGGYGMQEWADLYTPRQRLAMRTFADEVARVHGQVIEDGGTAEYAAAVSSLLALGLGKMAQYGSTQAMIATFTTSSTFFNSAFGRSDVPITWDFFEQYFFGEVGGAWSQLLKTAVRAFRLLPGTATGRVALADARTSSPGTGVLVATDPPYFDAIGYADLSDYFYEWHRGALKDILPDLFQTAATPKSGELTALPGKHGGNKTAAKNYFINGFTETFQNLQRVSAPDLPLIVVYASKEQGGRDEQSRWASILTAMIDADLEITGTWPIHGTSSTRKRGMESNAVATYVVMICRPRPKSAKATSLTDFNRALRRELPRAVHDFQAAGILPVDLAQAAMGPGMQAYSRYSAVQDQEGHAVGVEQALRLINAALSEVLDEQQGELDPYSRFAVAWWEKHEWGIAAFGEADQLARPQGISVDDLIRAGVAHYPRPGNVQVLGAGDLDRAWLPSVDMQATAWEAVHHLADRLIDGGGVVEAGRLLGRLGDLRDAAQALVYRLHEIAVVKGRIKDQERYNALIGSWSDLLAISATEKEGLF